MKNQIIEANKLRMGGINMLMHRTMHEFGRFCTDLASYRIYKEPTNIWQPTVEFFESHQELIDNLDTENPEAWADLFLEYWQWEIKKEIKSRKGGDT